MNPAPARWQVTYSFLALLACLSCSISASAQQTNSDASDSVDPKLARELRSPRSTIKYFLQSVNDSHPGDAVACLDLSHLDDSIASARSLGYVVRLKGTLDRMWRIDLSQIPDDPEYKSPFSLGEKIVAAKHFTGQDRSDALTIQLERDPQGLWRFSSETVSGLDDIWNRWKERPRIKGLLAPEDEFQTIDLWLEQQFPERLRQTTFLLPDYQWICLFALILIGFIADLITRFVLHRATHAWFLVFKTKEDNQVDQGLWRPVGLLVQAIIWYVGTRLIGLPPLALQILLVGLKVFGIVAAIWTAFLLINILSNYLARKAEATDTKFDDLLVPLVSKSLKVFVVCIGVLFCAEAFNLPVAGLLGGLGIGGIALAMASKDAVSNLFGSITVLVDRPFEVGDWVITGNTEGTVESVGFRSTRIRTFYNSQITLPNSLLTTAIVDNMGRRQFRRIKTMLSLQYDTTPEQMDAFCEGVREIIRRHPYTRKDYYHVYFNQYSTSSLDVLLYCFLECPDWGIELRERHRLFLDIMKLAQRLGCQFAFPTRTLHMFQEQAPPETGAIEDSDRTGQRAAAQIVGPYRSPQESRGPVEYRGPSDIDEDGDGE